VNLQGIFIREFFADFHYEIKIFGLMKFVPGIKTFAFEYPRANCTQLRCRLSVAFQFTKKMPVYFHNLSLSLEGLMLSRKFKQIHETPSLKEWGWELKISLPKIPPLKR